MYENGPSFWNMGRTGYQISGFRHKPDILLKIIALLKLLSQKEYRREKIYLKLAERRARMGKIKVIKFSFHYYKFSLYPKKSDIRSGDRAGRISKRVGLYGLQLTNLSSQLR